MSNKAKVGEVFLSKRDPLDEVKVLSVIGDEETTYYIVVSVGVYHNIPFFIGRDQLDYYYKRKG